jgi:HAD superfamily phosphatase
VAERVLVFDMDGVLVDVSESYRETIQQTVEYFSGRRPTREEIQQWKNRGGYNDDWKLSTAMIRAQGVTVEYEEVTAYFQEIFHGEDNDGLILRERWIAHDGLLERLAARARLAVFTGRLKWEAELTLGRFAGGIAFRPIVGCDAGLPHKPAPDGLLHIAKKFPGSELWYVGDTVDDARSAKAAGVPFVGIAAPGNPGHAALVRLLDREGARAVLDDINALESVLPA